MDESTLDLIFFVSWMLSIFSGLFLLIRFWEDEIGRLTGFYTFKPTFVYIFAMLIRYSKFHPYHLAGIEIIVSIVIVCVSWNLYKVGWGTPWLILILDTLRLSINYIFPLVYGYLEIILTLAYYFFPIFLAVAVFLYRERKIKLSLK